MSGDGEYRSYYEKYYENRNSSLLAIVGGLDSSASCAIRGMLATVRAQMKFTILLTGKNGQVGSELLRLLRRIGEVVAPDWHELDLFDAGNLRRAV